jgi:hypothetical protein
MKRIKMILDFSERHNRFFVIHYSVGVIIVFVFSLFLTVAMAFCQEKKEMENASENISENFVARENGLTHRVLFGGKDGFKAERFDDVYNIYNEARNIAQVKWMFTKIDKDEKGNQIFIALTDAPETVQKIIESLPQLTYIKTERLTKDMYEKHTAPWFAETRIKPRSIKDMLKSIVKESYRVDKKIIDFPEKIDLSTPENAYVSQKQLAISNRKDKIEQLLKMDYQHREISERERSELEQEMSEDWAKTFKTEYIVYEVLKFSDEFAFVFALRQFDDLYDGNMFQKKDDGLWYNLRNFQRDVPDEMVEDVKRAVAHLNLSPQSSKLKEHFDVHIAEIRETDWFKLLDDKQKKYVLWDERTFQYVYDLKNYEVGDERDVLEKRWIEQLEKPEPESEESEEPESGYSESVTLSPYDKAIFGLAIIKSGRAAELLLKISTEKVLKDNAHRHFATKALGILGDLSVILDLIPLIYHYNSNTRWDAQISLVRLTGQNFGTNAEAWGKWYNENREKLASKTNKELPIFDFTPIDWTFGCKNFELQIFNNPIIQKIIDGRFFEKQPNN